MDLKEQIILEYLPVSGKLGAGSSCFCALTTETIDHFKNGAMPKSQMSRNLKQNI
jgi:hypothetical protein